MSPTFNVHTPPTPAGAAKPAEPALYVSVQFAGPDAVNRPATAGDCLAYPAEFAEFVAATKAAKASVPPLASGEPAPEPPARVEPPDELVSLQANSGMLPEHEALKARVAALEAAAKA